MASTLLRYALLDPISLMTFSGPKRESEWPWWGVPMVTSASIGAPSAPACSATRPPIECQTTTMVSWTRCSSSIKSTRRPAEVAIGPKASRSLKYLVRQPCSRALRRMGVSCHSSSAVGSISYHQRPSIRPSKCLSAIRVRSPFVACMAIYSRWPTTTFWRPSWRSPYSRRKVRTRSKFLIAQQGPIWCWCSTMILESDGASTTRTCANHQSRSAENEPTFTG